MAFRMPDKNKGFSLVELLLVIVLMAIIMALVTLSGANMMESTSAQTEARRLIRSLQSLRSAWLACYADTQQMLGITTILTSDELTKTLSVYSNRSLGEENTRYGQISVDISPANTNSIYIGYKGPWHLDARAESAKSTMVSVLENQKNDYEIVLNADESIFIRVR